MLAGLNGGNHYGKAVANGREITIPAFVAPGRERTLVNGKEHLDDLDVTINDSWSFVGNLAKKYSDTLIGYEKKKSTDDVTKTVLLTMAAYLSDRQYLSCSPVTCLPISDYRVQRKTFARNLEGVYRIKFPFKVVNLEVVDVTVAPEAGCAAWDLFLDNKGRVIDGYSFKNIGVIDIGSRTTNVTAMYQMTYQDELSDTLAPLGMWAAYNDMQKEIKLQKDILIHQVEDNLDLINPAPYYKNLANAIVQQIMIGPWKSQPRFDAVVICGGGAIPLFPHFKAIWSNAILHPRPITANAWGCYKLAVARNDEIKCVHRV
ncbi:hypothetical protein EV210_101133 [Anaerospora hongkongensis]|uniref:Uncharacterized protein n=1 Tax=Anaerospora hongkongensis TaxID=244830 RepID=A0A4R1QAI3_9FIRM|nr:ParM/StbA family protein [Anaerospora hongkongensis]TCL39935.1 hypothetical protein EV210_101133 [Anaerospora hongkongensis]